MADIPGASHLMAAVADYHRGARSRDDWVAQIVDTIENPGFENAGKVHDWRNHIPELIKELWDGLSTETQICCYHMALIAARNEEWE